MSLAKSAASKLEWSKVISNLKLTGKTATQLTGFKKRNDEARRQLFALQQQDTEVDFENYRNVLNNKDVIAKIENYVKSYKTVTVDVSSQLSTLKAFETKAVENAQQTEKLVAQELTALQETLKNIESARAFDELTIEDVMKAKPDVQEKVSELVSKGKWEVPGYKEKFGDLNAM
ncbi:ATP synthase d subunit [Hanseniaspora osmophila]|uniref:ATP synthase subunit d, mitochondrial n=1 Tax=Hanseniaspora osmophila TaxID=56408 RepID=A0A1E5RBE0_9ASCO|nr:ATP synthase subunit d, mitochondrial [Hanseniaspora osmophila]